jgi:hypothetical protein
MIQINNVQGFDMSRPRDIYRALRALRLWLYDSRCEVTPDESRCVMTIGEASAPHAIIVTGTYAYCVQVRSFLRRIPRRNWRR